MINQIFSYTKETISILAPIFALVIASLGLQTWKKQLYGKSEYEVARKLLKATYKYREAINNVRNPFMSLEEMTIPKSDPDIVFENDERMLRYREVTNAYDKRWSKVLDARIEIDTELLEAEVLWGRTIKEKYINLFSVGKKLFINIRHYLHNVNPRTEDNLEFDRDIIYSKLIDENTYSEDDNYFNELNNSISEIENELKSHLNRKK